jgi:phospholipase/lecithinase/hemolysin
VHDAVRILRGIIEDLAAAGARHILVPNLPDVGLAAEASGQGPERSRLATGLSQAFNLALKTALDGVAERHRNLRLYRIDVFALHHAIVDDPAAFGFKNVRDPCAPGCPDPERWLLWDRTHPTTAAHLRLAEAALRVLDGERGPAVQK